MILGNICTRNCRFCGVPKGSPQEPDLDEPERVAHAVASLHLKYAVITSVTRDDLDDGGSSLFAATIKAIRMQSPGCRVEVLIPDFKGSESSLGTVLNASPDVLVHNVETIPSLYPTVRPKSDYRRSLELLSSAHAYGAFTKTGLMLGLGEAIDEVRAVMHELRKVDCSSLTLGQYLQPGKYHHPVEKYYHPDEFTSLRDEAQAMGFRHVAAGPLVRSSYRAEQHGAGDNLNDP
jgi:lipoic acid synthetase